MIIGSLKNRKKQKGIFLHDVGIGNDQKALETALLHLAGIFLCEKLEY